MDARRTILCVDDEPVNIALLEALLGPRGYGVTSAPSGPDALGMLAESHVDLVLLDVMMPAMDGYEVCRRIKEDERTRRIPVVMLTALSGRDDRIKGIEAGADDFISKPFDKGEVLARVAMLLKVKALNERLTGAYEDILGLVNVGNELIRAFDPLAFDLRAAVDVFAATIIRGSGETAEKPEVALVGFPVGGGEWSWRVYREGEGGVARTPTRPVLPAQVVSGLDPRLVSLNLQELRGPAAAWLLDAVAPLRIGLANAVCYLSPELCILLLNFGREVGAYDAAVLKSLVTQSLFLRSLALQVNETENAFAYTVAALARAAEVHDEDTGNHIQRVGQYCAALAQQIGAPEPFVRAIGLQAQTHDVGKIHVHPDLLRKTGELTPAEWADMQKHTIFGALILGDHPRLKMAKTVAMTHHEKWDGSGYPFGLKREEIPLEGRIVGLADQYDALRSWRYYKPAMDHAATVRALAEGWERTSPTHFDPLLLEAFLASQERFAAIFDRLSV